jgi:uncharacterized protein (DUF2147 family)
MTKWTSLVAATAMLFVASAVLAQSASVKSAASTEVGSKLEVRGYIGTPMLGRTQTWIRSE